MTPQKLNEGDVVQLHPEYGMFGGCFLVVTEPKSFGCQGYVQCLGQDGNPGGQAFLRPAFEKMELIGKAAFVIGRDQEE